MKEQYSFEKFKKENGITGYIVGKGYEIFKSHFPELDYDTFCILDENGCKGKLWQGAQIDIPEGNIHIEQCGWRQDLYNYTKQPVPYIKKINN